MNNLKVGELGEELASNYLKSNKFKVLARNYRKKFGEIDIICSKDEKIYFVEVKSILSDKDFLEERKFLVEKVNSQKIKRLNRAIHFYLKENNIKTDYSWRLSVCLVVINQKSKKADLEFIENFY